MELVGLQNEALVANERVDRMKSQHRCSWVWWWCCCLVICGFTPKPSTLIPTAAF